MTQKATEQSMETVTMRTPSGAAGVRRGKTTGIFDSTLSYVHPQKISLLTPFRRSTGSSASAMILEASYQNQPQAAGCCDGGSVGSSEPSVCPLNAL